MLTAENNLCKQADTEKIGRKIKRGNDLYWVLLSRNEAMREIELGVSEIFFAQVEDFGNTYMSV